MSHFALLMIAAVLFLSSCLVKTERSEIDMLKGMMPLIDSSPSIMFWRPQKVGSSTIVSILASYGFRFHALPRRKASNNHFCRTMRICGENIVVSVDKMVQYHGPNSTIKLFTSRQRAETRAQDQLSLEIPFRISLGHEICNMGVDLTAEKLLCAFKHRPLKEIFIVREPMARAISVYYFWGEIMKLSAMKRGILSGCADISAGASGVSSASAGNGPKMLRLGGMDCGRRRHHQGSGSRSLLMGASVGSRSSDRTGSGGASAVRGVRLGHLVGFGKALATGITNAVAVAGPHALASTAGSENHTIYKKFDYHGDEATVPPEDIAIAFGKTFPYTAGMPGPSFTWSLFSNGAEQAVSVIRAPERLMTLVTERLDESLVVMRHFLNTKYGDSGSASREDWGLADLVYVTRRKSLSSHPKAAQWPPSAVKLLESKLRSKGEYAVYEAANEALDARIKALTGGGVDIQQEVHTLRQLRERVSELCFTEEYLQRYKVFLERAGLRAHPSANKLRDVEDKFSDGGHEFSLNREILYSFDVCGSCEAHAILLAVEKDLGSRPSGNTVQTASVLVDLPPKYTEGRVQLVNCPK